MSWKDVDTEGMSGGIAADNQSYPDIAIEGVVGWSTVLVTMFHDKDPEYGAMRISITPAQARDLAALLTEAAAIADGMHETSD